jgi:hypothetical protein
MTRPIDLLRQGRREELWQMCCGFLDLSLEQFMSIQKRLLLEQIELLKNCELGRKVMRGAMPETVEEFREQVPLTKYGDYCPELLERRENVLPAKPAYWVHTLGKFGEPVYEEGVLPAELAHWIRILGRFGEYLCKWVPISDGFAVEYEKVAGALPLLATCRGRGDTSQLKEHKKALYIVGPQTYASGVLGSLVQQATGYDLLPANSDGMSFQQRIRVGLEEALYRGIDSVNAIPSVLVYVGEQINQQSGLINSRLLLSHPQALFRVIRALIRSKLAHRPMLPKDIWSIEVIVVGGTDSGTFRKRVKELWGKEPLEVYAGAEGGLYATQTWDYEGMTFVPNLNFFEFIPEGEWLKWQLDHSYQPRTVLVDEVKAGENYEIVITNLHGGVLARHRMGDMVKITSLHNDKLNIDIPQMVFYNRSDELIDISGFGRITEKIIWKAIENTGIPYVDWAAHKEVVNDKPLLHLYLELKNNYIASEKGVAAAVYEELRKLDRTYRYNIYAAYGDPETMLGSKPIQVSFLPTGAFANYISQRQAEGADLAHLKPPHVNPSDKVLSLLGAPRVVVEAVPAVEAERARV